MNVAPAIETSTGNDAVAIVAIGRNEGARLERCLASLSGAQAGIVYVDSGSSDGSVAMARSRGVETVELDAASPFSAARARNAGYAALKQGGTLPAYVQFIDGDCSLQPGWIEAARKALEEDPRLGVVTGWRSEIHRERSVYNAMCDFEWRRPAGDILTCGGDMMVRSAAFESAGGFNEAVIAAEDDEFCVRIRKAGWKIRRLPVEMTLHDAAMLHFSQWWRRAVRSGHGFAQVGAMHPGYFSRERLRVWIFGAILPVAALAGLVTTPLVTLGAVALYGLSYLRTADGLRRNGLPAREAASHAIFLTLSKFPNLQGMLAYWKQRLAGKRMEIIEYK